MNIVKAFNSNNLHTEIVIKGTIEEPLFRASDVGEILEMSNIRATIQNFDDSEKVVHTMETLGGKQQITFLTEKGLYKILFRSRKQIAETFQNWVCDVIKELRLSGTYNLKIQLDEVSKKLENTTANLDKKLIEEKTKQKQDFLLRTHAANTALVYIIKVKTFENGQYIIKIGESRNGVEARYKEHQKNYEECILLDCFPVNKSKQLEQFLHHHDKIRPSKVRDLECHTTENELFLIGKHLTYDTVTKIINDNIHTFNEWKVNDIMQVIQEENQRFLQTLLTNQNITIPVQNNNSIYATLLEKIEKLEKSNKELSEQNKQILERIDKPQIKTSTNFNTELKTLGPRLQKINPETGVLIKVYESVAECVKESKGNINKQSLKNAINYNTIYRGFRWMFVERDKDPNIIENYQPTKITRQQNIDSIAKLDLNKTKILNVYLDRKTAAVENGYQSPSALDNPVKNNKPSKGFYYMMYNNCDDELREKFEEEYGEPILYKDGLGQFDLNNNLVREFTSKDKCIKELNISDKTIKKSILHNVPYNSFYYKKLGSKIKMIID